MFTNKKINVVLDETNFHLWKQQVLLTVRSYQLEKILIGKVMPPAEKNSLNGTIPDCIGSLTSPLSHLILGENNFHGKYQTNLLKVAHLKLLDVGNNTFFELVREFGSSEHSNIEIKWTWTSESISQTKSCKVVESVFL
ncbi:hypothetical protein GQ457_06G023140 [Hibiscus cannabinus]